MSTDHRDGYQAEAVTAVYAGWQRGLHAVGVSMPTGTGKTHVMGALATREATEDGPRTMILVHRDTLVEQTVSRLRHMVAPGTSIGVLKAERNELGARVIVASVHSLRTERRRAMLPPIKTCIVDEAHVSVSPTYRRVYDQLGVRDGGARLAGFSATWSRSDQTGLGDVWQEIVFAKSIRWATQHGFLVRPRGIQVGDGVDLSGVGVSRATDDYREGDLERVVMLEEIRDLVVAGALRHASDRPGVLFAPTIEAAEYFAAALTEAGLRTEGIYAHTPPALRRQRFAAHRDGSIRILSTCTALAEGWDAPWCSAAHMVRPTRHQGLFVQQTGRTLRPWPGKQDALILDYVGVLDDMVLTNAIDLSVTRENSEGELIELPTDEVDDEDQDREMERRERTVRRRRSDLEVELFAGTSVQWLTSEVGLPFVSCGDVLVCLVEGPEGWNVAEVDAGAGPPGSRPPGRWVAEGLSSEEALGVASDRAEEAGEYLARRSASWRRGSPSTAQLGYAIGLGIDVEGLSRGQVSDRISIAKASRALAPVARWSQQWKAWNAQ